MDSEPVVVDQEAREWEAWPAEQVAQRGEAEWKTLISGGLTRSAGLTMGVARIPPGGSLRMHRHEQAEAYLVLEGTGSSRLAGRRELSARVSRCSFLATPFIAFVRLARRTCGSLTCSPRTLSPSRIPVRRLARRALAFA
jgi:hypothetical protein